MTPIPNVYPLIKWIFLAAPNVLRRLPLARRTYTTRRKFWRRFTHLQQWSSGRIHRCHRCDPGSIPGCCILHPRWSQNSADPEKQKESLRNASPTSRSEQSQVASAGKAKKADPQSSRPHSCAGTRTHIPHTTCRIPIEIALWKHRNPCAL